MAVANEFQTWVILVGSVVAAIAGVANLVWQHGDRNPRYRLVAGAAYPSLDNLWELYVVNTGKIPIEIADFGFLLFNGTSYSIPFESQIDSGVTFGHSPSTRLEPHEKFEANADLNGRLAGVYCTLTTSSVAKIRFFARCPIKIKVIWSLKYLLNGRRVN